MKRVIIYVRGENEELQEIICRVYAANKGYKVVYVTRYIEDVYDIEANDCDALLVASYSRISRNKIDYIEILNGLKEEGVELISVANQDDADKSISLAIDLFGGIKNLL